MTVSRLDKMKTKGNIGWSMSAILGRLCNANRFEDKARIINRFDRPWWQIQGFYCNTMRDIYYRRHEFPKEYIENDTNRHNR